jgi:carboxymethylenebutenolidase
MGSRVSLKAADGHSFAGYVAKPTGRTIGTLVVLQEIFGLNGHIRRVADEFAPRGYTVLAPALFDRVEPGCELGYDKKSVAQARAIRDKIPLEQSLADIQAAIDYLCPLGRVAVVGYCWGGSLAYLAATRLDGLNAAVAYYGGTIAKHADEKPRVPTMIHFAEHDHATSPADIEAVKTARPELPIYVYQAASHGFNCDDRGVYSAAAARLASERTLHFLADHLLRVQ